MNFSIIDIIEINVLLAMLFMLYKAINNKLTFNTRRIVLIFIPLLAFFRYFMKKNVVAKFSDSIPVINLNIIEVSSTNSPLSFYNLDMYTIYYIGVFAFLSFTLYKILKVLTIFRKYTLKNQNGFNILRTNQEKSFSFFNFIHLSARLNEEEKNIVLEHEIIHCEKIHSLDILIMEVYHAFFWYNPLLFLLKKELIHVHEYQVDKQMFKKYNSDYIVHLLANTLGISKKQILLTSQFNNNLTLAKRTKIMKENIKKSRLLFIVIPLLAFMVSFVSCEKIMDVNNSENIIKMRAYMTGDADKSPVHKEGSEAFFKFLGKNIKYPESAVINKLEGKVIVSFIVLKTGELTDFKILKSVSEEIDSEALRVMKLMKEWIPGEINGIKVDLEVISPIVFKLNPDEL